MLVASGTLTRAALGGMFAVLLAHVFFTNTALAWIHVDSLTRGPPIWYTFHMEYAGLKGARRRRSTGSTYSRSLWMTSPLWCGGGAYCADAAGTARVSQEHRCVPHRGTARPARRGRVDGFKLMTLHLSIATTLRTKQKSL